MAAERERQRVIIDRVEPEIDCGRFPIKRAVGERVVVEADVFTDGDDALRCLLLWCHEGDRQWSEVAMEALPDDLFRGAFTVPEMGRYRYGLTAWADPFRTWRRDLEERVLSEDVLPDLSSGAGLIAAAAARAQEAGRRADARVLSGLARDLARGLDPEARLRLAFDPELVDLMDRYADRSLAATYGRELAVVVDRERARFSSWYELVPGSAAEDPRRTSDDGAECLDDLAGLGFDVVYLHLPSLHSEPGTEKGFRRLVLRARGLGLEVALGLSCDGDPADGAWEERRRIVDRWIGLGVRAFVADDPERLPVPFWEWLIGEVKRAHPEVIFLAAAATRPKVMDRLAKVGFTQSATGLGHMREELTAYWQERTAPPVAEFFRPNVWFRPELLESGGWPVFAQRLILAATLAASYSIHGPAFELLVGALHAPGSAGSFRDLVARVNRIRRENPALQSNAGLAFHGADNGQLLCYSKATADTANVSDRNHRWVCFTGAPPAWVRRKE